MELLEQKKPAFLVITGKRRVGKTELIKQFTKNRKALAIEIKNKELSESEAREIVELTTDKQN